MAQLIDVAQLIRAVNDLYVSKLLAGAAATLVVYDWILVFSVELETIHKSRWTLAKGLFYYIRIVTPPGVIFGAFQLSDLRPALTTLWVVMVIFGLPTSLFAANALLALRLVALYQRNRFMVWFIYIFLFASYAATLGLLIDGVVTFIGTMFYSEGLHTCTSLGKSRAFSGVFYAPAVFEAFLFTLTAYRAWKDAKFIAGPGSAPFLTVLYRDGIIAFFVMIGMRIWNMWIYTTAPLSSYNMGTVLMWAINTILTTRVYMNLVWLTKRPMLDTAFATRTPAVSANIRMRVHTFTEFDTDGWKTTHGVSTVAD